MTRRSLSDKLSERAKSVLSPRALLIEYVHEAPFPLWDPWLLGAKIVASEIDNLL